MFDRRMIIALAVLATAWTMPASASNGVYSVTGQIATAAGGETRDIGPADFAAIGEIMIETKVLTLGERPHKVKGILGRALFDYVGGKGTKMTVTALDGYTMEIPMEDFLKYDVVIATEIDGKRLSIREKGPAWIIYPVSQHKELDDIVYETRSVWQIKSIRID